MTSRRAQLGIGRMLGTWGVFWLAIFSWPAPAQITPIRQLDGVIRYERTRPVAEPPSFWRLLRDLFRMQPTGQLPFGRSVAFLAGVSEYSTIRPQLRHVATDLDDLRKFLLEEAGFDVVYEARDATVTRSLIEDYMVNNFTKPGVLTAEDRLLFYYSGHGADLQTKVGFLQFSKAVAGNFAGEHVLPIGECQTWSRLNVAKHVLFIFDCCASGLAVSEKAGEDPSQRLLRTLSGDGSRYLLTAGTADQSAYQVEVSSNKGYGVFTRALVDSLRSGGADKDNRGFATLHEVFAHVEAQVGQFAAEQERKMTPQLWRLPRDGEPNQGTFVFLNRKAVNPRLDPQYDRLLSIQRMGTEEQRPSEARLQLALRAYHGLKDSTNVAALRSFVDRYSDLPDAAWMVEVFKLKIGDLATRIAAIRALEEIANGSDERYWPVVQTLAEFVRERSPWQAGQSPQAPGLDVQQALTVLGRRRKSYGNGENQRLDLNRIEVQGADLREAHLEGANLAGSNLSKANLWSAHLEKADLGGVDLEEANLEMANLKEALLWVSHVVPPVRPANLRRAILTGANLEKANLWGADLEGAVGLTNEQLRSALINEYTRLPAYLKLEGGRAITTGLRPGDVRTNPADGQQYVWIPPGEFQMGCSPGDNECDDHEKPPHKVRMSRAFWLGRTEVTQAAYQKVVGANPSNFKGLENPVETVNWNEAREYCEAVGGRLPTEAEWEYAARAGSQGARYGQLDTIASDLSAGRTQPVGQKQKSAWGLHDMLGNVWEWVSDWYQEDYYETLPSTAVDPKGPASGTTRVLRGGSWGNDPKLVRTSLRSAGIPVNQANYVGFRCARDLAP